MQDWVLNDCYLTEEFEIKNLDVLQYFLGLQLHTIHKGLFITRLGFGFIVRSSPYFCIVTSWLVSFDPAFVVVPGSFWVCKEFF